MLISVMKNQKPKISRNILIYAMPVLYSDINTICKATIESELLFKAIFGLMIY